MKKILKLRKIFKNESKEILFNDFDNYLLHPKEIKQMMTNKNEVFHLVNKVN